MRAKSTKRSCTKDEASELDELLTKRNRIANELRSKIEEFHGLERELIDFQEQMMVDYERTRPLKNARELGDTRENIVRSFLLESGLFPSRCAHPRTGVSGYCFHSKAIFPERSCSRPSKLVQNSIQ
jgi:hypothetical protein